MSSSKNRRRLFGKYRHLIIRGLIITAVLGLVLILFSRRDREPNFTTSSLTEEPLSPASFTHEIRPLLATHCYSCHSGRKATPPRLDTKDVASVFVDLERKRGGLGLPPDDIHRDLLTLRDSSLLMRWRDEGGQYEPHWAFQALPRKLKPAKEFREATWARGEIDQFHLEHLAESHARPKPKADILTLIRRLSIDLTGLPPSLELLEKSLSWEDDQEQQYLALVEEMLSQDSFGETLGDMWSEALFFRHNPEQEQSSVPFSRWQDWMTTWFNMNRPIDEFIRLQIAGDQLGEPLATAIFRAPLRQHQAGLTSQDQLRSNLADRIYRLSHGFFGFPFFDPSTGHPGLDPITSSDLDHLQNLFQASNESGNLPVGHPPGAPTIIFRSESAKAEIAKTEASIEQLEEQLQTNQQHEREALDQWILSFPQIPDIPDLLAVFHCDTPGETLVNQALGQQNVQGSAPHALVAPGIHQNAFVLGGGSFAAFQNLCPTSPNQAWTLSAWIRLLDLEDHKTILFERTPDKHKPGRFFLEYENEILRAGWERDGPAQSLVVSATVSSDQARDWAHLSWTCDGSGKAAGLQLYWNGKPLPQEVLADSLPTPVFHPEDPQPTRAGADNPNNGSFLLDELHAHGRALTPLEIKHLIDQQTLSLSFENPNNFLRRLTDYYFSSISTTERALRAKLGDQRRLLDSQKANPWEISILKIPETQNLKSSSPLFSKIFATTSPLNIKNRRELAEWMTHPDHPLTARVFINHLWTHFYGQGLVPTGFGLEGSAVPQHALLDWLARDFIESGWDLKQLCRQIVTSNNYRQSRPEPPFLSPSQQFNVLLHISKLNETEAQEAQALYYQPVLAHDWRVLDTAKTPRLPEELLIKSARRITRELLPRATDDHAFMRELFLRIRSHDESHPEFKILLNLLEHQKESLAESNDSAPKLILGGGAKEEESSRLDPTDWGAWIEICTSLLHDQGLRRQR